MVLQCLTTRQALGTICDLASPPPPEGKIVMTVSCVFVTFLVFIQGSTPLLSPYKRSSNIYDEKNTTLWFCGFINIVTPQTIKSVIKDDTLVCRLCMILRHFGIIVVF